MTSVVEHQLQSNAILQKYKTVMESDFPGDARGVPVVGGAAVAGVMQRHQHNNPIPYLGNGQPTGTSILGGVMDTGDMFSQDEYNSTQTCLWNIPVYYLVKHSYPCQGATSQHHTHSRLLDCPE